MDLSRLLSKRSIKIQILFFVVLGAIAWWLNFNDPHRDYAEKHIHSSSELQNEIGEVKKLKLIRKYVFMRETGVGNAQEPDRKLYRYLVSSQVMKAKVEVLVQLNDDSEVESVKIESVDVESIILR